MYYITLDLEWNQAYAQKAIAVQKQLACRLRGEVIQIGAVKLDSRMQPCGSYQAIVKPKYFKKIHRMVADLTGISQEQMDAGISLSDAAESFRRWCGEDFVFLTWGPDDIPMLKENFHVHKIDMDWLDCTYDLQAIFNMQTDGGTKQRSLEYAMEYFEIPQRLPAHDALNDAYFTALVAKRLDVPQGIRDYGNIATEHLYSAIIGDADGGDDGYVTINEMLEDTPVSEPKCPLCDGLMKKAGGLLHSKGQKYTLHYKCEEHGDMLLTLKLHRNFNDTWRAKLTVDEASEEMIIAHEAAIEKSNQKRRSARHRGRRKKKNATV
ncbi:MAG: exonuclease domain-containing protein [Clostridia bacterium]|nr:exonuclease domain-containing protein [Clostridia bacterium]